jgi:GET complex subunit GET2
MADAEETPAQRQARLRRQKREAKINANASDRLDKITRLSGRTPENSEDIHYSTCIVLTRNNSAT